MNPLKDSKLQSSLQFFNARVKNQYEDLKLQREIRIIDRRIGMTTSEINWEVRAIRKEMQTMRKSSGYSGEGLMDDEEAASGSHSQGRRSVKNSKKDSSRTTSAGARAVLKTEESVWERLARPKSAPDEVRSTEPDRDTVPDEAVKLPPTKPRLTAMACSKAAWGKRRHGSDPPSSGKLKKEQGRRCIPTDASQRLRLYTLGNEGPHSGKVEPANHKQTGGLNSSQTKQSKDIQPPSDDSSMNKLESFFLTDQHQTPPSTSSNELPKSKSRSLRNILKPTPLSNGSVLKSDAADGRWLKSALKTKENTRREKRVTILEDGELHEQQRDTSSISSLGRHSDTPNSMAQSDSHDTDSTPSLGLLSLLTSSFTEPPRSPTPNVIPDVRRNPKPTEEDATMKRRRDSLLKASIVSLMGGGRNRRKAAPDPAAESQPEVMTKEQDQANLSTYRKSQRRISFRAMGKVMMSKNHLSVQKRSTLGRRLKVHSVQQSAMTTKSIKANLTIDEEDSDSGNEAATTSTPNPDAAIKSKISKSWRQDLELEKLPALEDDLKQLQMLLAASHLSRERELHHMQQQHLVDHLKVIDEGRKQRVVSKVNMYLSILEEQRDREKRQQKINDVFGGPAQSLVVQKWRSAARSVVTKK